jgi:hypothetical protein
VIVDTFTKVKDEASKYGVLINESKTKYLKCTRKQVRGNKLETLRVLNQSNPSSMLVSC